MNQHMASADFAEIQAFFPRPRSLPASLIPRQWYLRIELSGHIGPIRFSIPNAAHEFSETAMNIYVGNLSYSTTDADLREAFSRFGEVAQVNLISDKFTGQSKGFGFVEMPNNSNADAAIKGLNGTDLKGRALKVNEAKPRSDRGSTGRRF